MQKRNNAFSGAPRESPKDWWMGILGHLPSGKNRHLIRSLRSIPNVYIHPCVFLCNKCGITPEQLAEADEGGEVRQLFNDAAFSLNINHSTVEAVMCEFDPDEWIEEVKLKQNQEENRGKITESKEV